MKPPALSALLFWGFVALMTGLCVVFVLLGNWQMDRLAEKQALIDRVEQRLDQPPVPPPTVGAWITLDPRDLEFRPLTLTGRFVPEETVRVFTALSSGTARGPHTGPGYWIVTPFRLDTGGMVFVNRGFVPEGAPAYEPAPDGPVEITGLARSPETESLFTPAPDFEARIEWVREPRRLARFVHHTLLPYAPFTLDQAAGPDGTLPQGGETVVEFPNNHLGYALTWYGFALITPVLLGFWIWRQRRAAS